MKIAIFHDYFRVIGGAEKLVLIMAKEIGADIITSEINPDLLSKVGVDGVHIIPLGKLSTVPDILPMISRKRFESCDFSKEYDYFIFSGNFSIYAAKTHTPNMWYCHSPLRGLYDLKEKNVEATKAKAGANTKAEMKRHE